MFFERVVEGAQCILRGRLRGAQCFSEAGRGAECF